MTTQYSRHKPICELQLFWFPRSNPKDYYENTYIAFQANLCHTDNRNTAIQSQGAKMLHDLRSLQTYPPPTYPTYELYFRAKDEISVAEVVEELEGHRKPLFYIKTISEEEQEILVIFKKPFQEEEKWLIDHLYQVIQDRLPKE